MYELAHEDTVWKQDMQELSDHPLKLDKPALFRSKAYIDGAWVDADDGATFEVSNPADGRVLAEVPNQGVAETRRAIEAASAAWPAWRSKTAKERAAILRRWFELMVENKDDLARLMTAEQGKPIAESAGEIFIYFFLFFMVRYLQVLGLTILL